MEKVGSLNSVLWMKSLYKLAKFSLLANGRTEKIN